MNYDNIPEEELISYLRDGDGKIIEYIIEKYKELLDSEESATDKFFKLQEQIHKDSHSTVFRLPGRFSRNDMYLNIMALLNSKIISIDDLSEFSEELQDYAKAILLGGVTNNE